MGSGARLTGPNTYLPQATILGPILGRGKKAFPDFLSTKPLRYDEPADETLWTGGERPENGQFDPGGHVAGDLRHENGMVLVEFGDGLREQLLGGLVSEFCAEALERISVGRLGASYEDLGLAHVGKVPAQRPRLGYE